MATKYVIQEVYTCKCREGFNWKTQKTYRGHFKSKRHENYETEIQEFEHRKNITQLQIDFDRLKRLYAEVVLENERLKNSISLQNETPKENVKKLKCE